MTISEMIITAMVASPATLYIECNGKKYRDAIELVKEHGNRLVESAEVLSGGGIRITMKPEVDIDLDALGFPEELGPFGEGDLAPAEEVLGA